MRSELWNVRYEVWMWGSRYEVQSMRWKGWGMDCTWAVRYPKDGSISCEAARCCRCGRKKEKPQSTRTRFVPPELLRVDPKSSDAGRLHPWGQPMELQSWQALPFDRKIFALARKIPKKCEAAITTCKAYTSYQHLKPMLFMASLLLNVWEGEYYTRHDSNVFSVSKMLRM